jgi:hypothetical protein
VKADVICSNFGPNDSYNRNIERCPDTSSSLEDSDMDRRMSAGIAVVVALAVGFFLFMLVRQRAMAESEARTALAEVARLEAEEALGRGNKAMAEARQPRWEYQVLSIAGSDEAVNQAIGRLTEDRWEYVGVIPSGSEPDRPYARMLFKRMKRPAKHDGSP